MSLGAFARLLVLVVLVLLPACRLRQAPNAGAPASGASAAPMPASNTPNEVTLKQAGEKRGRKMGVALATWFFDDPAYPALAAREFDSLTPENEMKWYAVEPEPGKFDFRGGDKLVAFAKEHGMRVRGHTLVWHSQLATWAKSLRGAELRAAMLRHVTETAAHFKGQVAHWDVVNEAVGDHGRLRVDSPFTALGREYLAEAFRAAHAADANALLFYNDYDVEGPSSPKTDGAFELVKWLKESGVPIHGMGLQVHVDPRRWPGADELQRTLERFAGLGLSLELTEIDVPVGALPGSLEQKLAAQKELMRGIVRACLAVKSCTGLTFWGLTDRYSWLASPEWAPLRGPGPHLPLPFDVSFRRKPMYDGVVEALLSE